MAHVGDTTTLVTTLLAQVLSILAHAQLFALATQLQSFLFSQRTEILLGAGANRLRVLLTTMGASLMSELGRALMVTRIVLDTLALLVAVFYLDII